ncbi:MAG: FkbM family methyltransferase [Spirochaetales bacterium]|nr:FkbM family methyltransferase [Spirochaetales bacterium]
MKQLIRSVINAVRRPVGVTEQKDRKPRGSLPGCLQQVARFYSPVTVLDVGAGSGTPVLYSAFPGARHILFEPLHEHKDSLEALLKVYPRMQWIQAAVGSSSGQAFINVHSDHLHGSSLLKEQMEEFDGQKRNVDIVTLEEVCTKLGCSGPFLLKIDTQGNELEVLKGAGSLLLETEYVLLEASLFEFYRGAPLVEDVIEFMKQRDFALYDVIGKNYRLLDNALAQLDLAFVKRNGIFRESNLYATPEQWAEATK